MDRQSATIEGEVPMGVTAVADDLEDADALSAVIETLEPAGERSGIVEDLIRSLMLIADATRPRRK
jgi:hypothetical protein